MKRVLFLGNIPVNDSKSIGGATVLTKSILDFLQKNKSIKITHIQYRKNWKRFGQIKDFIFLIIKAPFLFIKQDVISVHASIDFHFTIGPIIWIYSKLFRKKIVYHFFGGFFHHFYDKLNPIGKIIIRNTILKSDVVFFETQFLISKFSDEGFTNCRWLPNARKLNESISGLTKFKKKFVFISKVTPQKGINEIAEVCNLLPKDYEIDIYGPLDTKYYTIDFFSNSKLNYKGVINNDEVLLVLSNYNILLLPTKHITEGHPGIIIEALSIGMPTISTTCGAISEVVNHGHNGIIIKPNSVNELKKAMEFFNIDNYTYYREQALKSFDKFNEVNVFNKLIKAYLD